MLANQPQRYCLLVKNYFEIFAGIEGERRRTGKEEHKGMREVNKERGTVFPYSPQHDP